MQEEAKLRVKSLGQARDVISSHLEALNVKVKRLQVCERICVLLFLFLSAAPLETRTVSPLKC